jgi:tRNA-dihydrouridine synthase
MDSFWNTLKQPITCLAPMDDVTDTVFRQIVADCARPDVFFTEFVNVEGLCSPGRKKLTDKLRFDQSEHPIVAQIWGLKPENYLKVATEIANLGFDGLDINMGCPVKDVTSHGCGSALIDNPKMAGEIILAVQEGIRKAKIPIPISVKTRIGFRTMKTESWIKFLLGFNLDALIIHGRTAQEMSKVPAHCDEIGKAVKIRDVLGVKTVIIGNGDVRDYRDGCDKAKTYGVDGIMIGRGIFNDLLAFDRKDHTQPDGAFMTQLMEKHIDLFMKTWEGKKHFAILKKFFKIYISGFDRASEVRDAVMMAETPDQVETIMQQAGLFHPCRVRPCKGLLPSPPL